MKMRIAFFVAGCYTMPPPKGVIFPPMQVLNDLIDGLVRKGHDITLFAPKGSKAKCRIINNGLNPIFKTNNPLDASLLSQPDVREKEKEIICGLWDQYLLSLLYKGERKGKFDIINIHLAHRALPFASLSTTPIVYTLHDPLYSWMIKVFRLFQSKNQYFISLSDAQRKPVPDLNWVDTIYNGIDLKKFPYSQGPKNQLLFLGRILPRKGPDIAIQVAKMANEKLVIVGDPKRGEFWKKRIKPFLDAKITFQNWVASDQTYKYYRDAKAILVPIQWEEPFGLVMIEAMACGTPVIAFRRGSVPEVVIDGKTGFIVDTVEEMVAVIKKIEKIDRKECRKLVEEKFSVKRMVDDYEKTYYKLISENKNA